MSAAIRYEWRRISTIRSTWILLAIGIVLAGLVSLAIGWAIKASASNPTAEFGDMAAILNLAVANFLVWVAFGTVAAQAFGQDYRHGTIRLTLTAFPNRDRVFWARSLVASAVIVAGMLVALILSAGVLAAFGISGAYGDLAGYVGRSILNLVGYCFIVIGITLMTRVLALGVVIPLVFSVVFEGIIVPMIVGFAGRSSSSTADDPWFVKLLPFRAGSDFASGTDVATSGLVFLAWVVVIAGVGYVMFKKRDA